MDYYFGDELRWTYGFDNPNKTAALIASILPLVWLLAAWPLGMQARLARWLCITAAARSSVPDGGCCSRPDSRGGVAGAAGGCLLASSASLFGRGPVSSGKKMDFLLWCCCCLGNRRALRLHAGGGEKRGVDGWARGLRGNRLALWSGGLRMIAENPLGVGTGRSGQMYMQWYEPLDLTAGYRTMVNSFLTYLVEQGLPVFGVTIFAAASLWCLGGRSRRGATMPFVEDALKGSMLAFAIAGFFSTTMEEPWVWLPAGASLLALLWIGVKGALAMARMPPRPGAAVNAGGAWLTKLTRRLAFPPASLSSYAEPCIAQEYCWMPVKP